MEKGGKIDKWVLRLLGGENTNDVYPGKSDNSSYEELLMQEEAHRQALEQQLLDAREEREFLAAQARAEAQHQREMLRITNDAIALDQKRERDANTLDKKRERDANTLDKKRERDANALDQKREKDLEFMADFKRENPTVTSIISNGDSFQVTWDPSLNSTAGKSQREIECMQCFKKTPAATFCSHCGQEL
jgi:hypothetical protein